MATFYEVITAAINDIESTGYSPARVEYWSDLIQKKLRETMPTVGRSQDAIDRELRAIYGRLVDKGGLLKLMPSGVSQYTIDRLRPALRGRLSRALTANQGLIRLNKDATVLRTRQRFEGWASSIPEGGSKTVEKRATSKEIRKALASLPFEERRVAIDQGQKLFADLCGIAAEGSGAIAGRWSSQWQQPNYNYREDHKERDGLIYVLRDGWAYKEGLITSCDGFMDEITRPAEEVYCRCRYVYIFALRKMPDEFITKKGWAWIAEANEKRKQIGIKI